MASPASLFTPRRLREQWAVFKAQQLLNLSLVHYLDTADIRCAAVKTFEPALVISIVEDVYISGLPAMMYRRLDRPFDILRQSVNYGDLRGVTKAFLQRGLRRQAPHPLDDAVCLAVTWSANYWHWLFENLPKVILAEGSGFRGVYLVPDQPFVRASLAMLGIDELRVVCHDGRLWRVRRLHLPTPIDGQRIGDYPRLIKELRHSLGGERGGRTPGASTFRATAAARCGGSSTKRSSSVWSSATPLPPCSSRISRLASK